MSVVVASSRRGVSCQMRIDSKAQKRNRSEVYSLTSDFGEFLLATPMDDRSGRMFVVPGVKSAVAADHKWIGKVISRIGKRAGVVAGNRDGKVKHASAHDLRRAFGQRLAYAPKMTAIKLKRLMRHRSIETTLRYYVGTDGTDALDDVFEEYRRQKITREREASPAMDAAAK